MMKREVATIVEGLLHYIAPERSLAGTERTPERVAKMYEELLCGYDASPEEIMTTFPSEGYDEMVLLTNIPFYSLCEHHMLPFVGKAHVGYVPNGSIVGLSKIPRLLEIYARRLQVQERLTSQVADALTECLDPVGAICIVEAEHFCMTMRGIQRPGTVTTTSALRGVFLEDSKARSEALSLIRRGDRV
jgi:GTP cyclohydrolase IA